MLAPTTRACAREIERFGGTVEKFIGDAVMAVFGAPVAHEDDPERAVRAALAVREAVQELNEANPALDLHVRIGVNTGEAVVALDARPSERRGHGRRRRRQHRLPACRAPRRSTASSSARRPTGRPSATIEYERAATRSAPRGRPSRSRVWEAVAARARLGVDVHQRGGAPLVGRARGARLALGRRSRARCASAHAQLVTLVGVPGIGKSRLVWELAEQVDADPELIVFWRQGRSLPYGEGVAFWAVAEMVKAQAGHPRDRFGRGRGDEAA